MWLGADPGGIDNFGVARLAVDGRYQTKTVSSVDQAIEFFGVPAPIGIDCPMWWSGGPGGGRLVDAALRKRYQIRSGTIQSVNSLKGSAVVQGILLAMRMRLMDPNCFVTETHPKALFVALGLNQSTWDWAEISERFALHGPSPRNEHERDALFGAVAAREATLGRWTADLATNRNPGELDPKSLWFGPVSYMWPEQLG